MVRQYIFDIARYWLEQGIDGWRLDVAYEIKDDSFWQEFRQVVRRANPEAYIVGEIAWEAQHWLQGDQFDAVMNYQFMQACLGFFGAGHIDRIEEQGMMGLPPTDEMDAASFSRRMEQLTQIYPWPAVLAQLNLLDSHDMPRFLTLVQGDLNALVLATFFQMTYPGAPCVYYGDEIGLLGGRDPGPRAAFPWDTSRWNVELLGFFQEAIALRRAHPALRTGEMKTLYAADQALVFARWLPGEAIMIAINNHSQPTSIMIELPENLPLQGYWLRRFGSGQAHPEPGYHRVRIELPAHSGSAWKIIGRTISH